MRQGGVAPAFSSQVDEKSGRVDIVITRPGDQTGASTAGLLAALLVEPVAAGTGSLSLSGSASVPGGGRGAAAVPRRPESRCGNHGRAASPSSSCWS